MGKAPGARRYQNQQHYLLRINILFAAIILCALLLILRLAYLQLSQYKLFTTLSLKNQMSIVPIAPARGIIYDRYGVVLAENMPIYILEIIPERVKSLESTLRKLQQLLPSITEEDIQNFYKARRQNPAYSAIPFKLKLSESEVAKFASNQYQFSGVNIKAISMRYYPMGEITSHLLGYVARISPKELKDVDYANYRATHFIGKSGIEKFYETELHGKVGYQQVETDASGRTLRVLSKQPPMSGHKLYLSIDARLQKTGYQALQDARGAMVLISVKNGEILAMVSSPSFDPNLFVNGISHDDYKLLSDEGNRPLYNRAVRGLYPPASTVKPFIALAGLNKGLAYSNDSIFDPGWYRLPGVKHAYRDWKHGGHGFVDVKRAIMVSCDTYFYQLGKKLGIDAIESMLRQFGFGELSNIDLSEEASGLVPSVHWKRSVKKLPWYPGDTLITSIGQGFSLATPLQLASATATLSQKGRRFRPHLLMHQQGDDQQILPYTPIEVPPVHPIAEEHWALVHNAMHEVIVNNSGTGYRFGRNAPYSVAGKTGTAQVFSLSQDEKKQYKNIPKALRDHSLFIGFAPMESPEVAIAVIVEHDTSAAQVARLVLDQYFDLRSQGQLNAQEDKS